MIASSLSTWCTREASTGCCCCGYDTYGIDVIGSIVLDHFVLVGMSGYQNVDMELSSHPRQPILRFPRNDLVAMHDPYAELTDLDHPRFGKMESRRGHIVKVPLHDMKIWSQISKFFVLLYSKISCTNHVLHLSRHQHPGEKDRVEELEESHAVAWLGSD